MSSENLRGRLVTEIRKWTEKLEGELSKVSGDEKFLQNISAYLKDSKHFYQKEDLIRSFECLIWAWAILQVGKEVGLVFSKD